MIAAIVGARPNFVKHAALAGHLPEETMLIHTGQHYDYEMSRVFFDHLDMPSPDVNLGIHEPTHCLQLSKMLRELENLLAKENIDAVVVYGDTNSTLAGALCANKLGLKLAHVEAGVRHFDRSVPEEVNRVLIDHIADLLLCPTEAAVQHAGDERCPGTAIWTGDLHYDLYLKTARHLRDTLPEVVADLIDAQQPYLLVTVHRSSNTDELGNLLSIAEALIDLKTPILFPVHPRTRNALEATGLLSTLQMAELVHLIRPLDYTEFISVLMHSHRVLTDSGGVQKEAYFCGVPCVTLRQYSPWPETQRNGWNRIIAPQRSAILDAVMRSPDGERVADVFGDGNAGAKIAEAIRRLCDG